MLIIDLLFVESPPKGPLSLVPPSSEALVEKASDVAGASTDTIPELTLVVQEAGLPSLGEPSHAEGSSVKLVTPRSANPIPALLKASPSSSSSSLCPSTSNNEWPCGGSNSALVGCRRRRGAFLLPRFGGPEALELKPSVALPDLKPREVLVRARAVSINPLDLRMRSGYGRSIFEPLLPLILGRDISGEVAAVGASVSSLTIGQEVFGALHPTAVRGTYADYAILSENELTLKPLSVSHVEASAIPFAALTAWRALKSTARIAKG
ncbi:reticulon-4-interacting protein 1 homolog, mitochondrial-like, partial [Asparagus officinalis]|uniref:reticulon-4-interacting protein 1 homolog, mitochondrial-like n=1 Tax=Asparagus officinalis TaxID=4686 RepID=UPI00098E78D8